MLMNKLGRKNTVMLSLIVTILSLLIPLFGESFTTMLIAVCRVRSSYASFSAVRSSRCSWALPAMPSDRQAP
jgi:hypothetical protein